MNAFGNFVIDREYIFRRIFANAICYMIDDFVAHMKHMQRSTNEQLFIDDTFPFID